MHPTVMRMWDYRPGERQRSRLPTPEIGPLAGSPPEGRRMPQLSYLIPAVGLYHRQPWQELQGDMLNPGGPRTARSLHGANEQSRLTPKFQPTTEWEKSPSSIARERFQW
ncbi:unnamed protein product [Euphydryas editha]|uniref:Uncharacterized protein n=1 Tax=Euphydryas editha TaxID=104508 RepID=A0AAU9UA35_EUPED|nr:unnamed protein product [Euphydryas editha]